MTSVIYKLFFLLLTIWILLKAIGFAIYEIKELDNKTGGVVVICFSVYGYKIFCTLHRYSHFL